MYAVHSRSKTQNPIRRSKHHSRSTQTLKFEKHAWLWRQPLSVAMEKLGLRAPFRDNGPVVYEGPSERTAGAPKRSQLAKEEALLERMIVSIINSKQWDKLQPNSGNSVEIGDAHVCVNYHEEETMRCRMWEWQGHIIVYDDTKGYVPEYVYGNHMEILQEELAEELRRMLSAGFGGFGAQPFWNAK